MTECIGIQDHLPWYVTGALPAAASREVAEHLVGCGSCRDELAGLVRLRHDVCDAAAQAAGPSRQVWERIVDATHGRRIAHIDIGSFLFGFSLGASVRGRRVPIRGDVRILGRAVPLFRYDKRRSA